jgi:hypothetical protein
MIDKVEITIEYPESIEGKLRLDTISCYGNKGELIQDFQGLVNNDEYFSERSLILDIAKEINVSPDIIEVV